MSEDSGNVSELRAVKLLVLVSSKLELSSMVQVKLHTTRILSIWKKHTLLSLVLRLKVALLASLTRITTFLLGRCFKVTIVWLRNCSFEYYF